MAEAFIIGSGMNVPESIVSNEELAGKLGLDPDQIFKSSGIRNRRWATTGITTASLAAAALENALSDAGLNAADVDYLIFGTMTPDRFIPGSAPAVQKILGLGEIPCLDIRNTCCNALYAFQIARSLILSGTASKVAICLAETQSRWLDLSAASGTISMLFGDGAAALLVSGEEQERALRIIDIHLATDGNYVDDLGIRCPGSEFGVTDAEGMDHRPRMVGQSVILQASRRMAAACRAVIERNNLTIADIGWIVPHQANANLLAQVGRSLGFKREGGVVTTLEDFGNTSSASMGIALDVLRRSGDIKQDDYVVLPAFGAGFTWGAGLCRAC
jgi:3-oxoacyl-[acyl-carrier-protein] synthase III